MNIYEEIRSLIIQGKSNKEIQDSLYVTYNQINYQRRKLRNQSMQINETDIVSVRNEFINNRIDK